MIKPSDIESIVFDKTFIGYVPAQVDEFLENLALEYEVISRENKNLIEEVKVLRKEVENYRNLENTLKQTLLVAKTTSDNLIKSAEKKANLILEESEAKSKREIEEKILKIKEIEKEYDYMILSYNRFKNRYKSFLESSLLSLEEINLIDEEKE